MTVTIFEERMSTPINTAQASKYKKIHELLKPLVSYITRCRELFPVLINTETPQELGSKEENICYCEKYILQVWPGWTLLHTGCASDCQSTTLSEKGLATLLVTGQADQSLDSITHVFFFTKANNYDLQVKF